MAPRGPILNSDGTRKIAKPCSAARLLYLRKWNQLPKGSCRECGKTILNWMKGKRAHRCLKPARIRKGVAIDPILPAEEGLENDDLNSFARDWRMEELGDAEEIALQVQVPIEIVIPRHLDINEDVPDLVPVDHIAHELVVKRSLLQQQEFKDSPCVQMTLQHLALQGIHQRVGDCGAGGNCFARCLAFKRHGNSALFKEVKIEIFSWFLNHRLNKTGPELPNVNYEYTWEGDVQLKTLERWSKTHKGPNAFCDDTELVVLFCQEMWNINVYLYSARFDMVTHKRGADTRDYTGVVERVGGGKPSLPQDDIRIVYDNQEEPSYRHYMCLEYY